MALAPILRPEGLNVSGQCYLDVIPVADVQSMPFPIMLNVTGDVVPKPGKVWIRINLAPPGSRLVENWELVNGEQVSDLTITGFAAKDELEKLNGLWDAKNDRWLVALTCLDGDQLIAGRPEEGCRLLTKRRDRGDDGQVLNGYSVEFTNRRFEPVPFYQGTAPEFVDPTECPTLPQLIAPEQGDDVFSYFSTEQRTQAIQAMMASTIWGMLTPAQVSVISYYILNQPGADIWAILDGTQQADAVNSVSGSVIFALLTTLHQVQAINSLNGADIWTMANGTVQGQILAEAGAAVIADIDGATLWGMLDGTQQAAVLVAAGVVTVARINNTGPPYTDIIIDPTP